MIKMVKPFLVQAGSAQFAFVDPPAALYKFFGKEAQAQDLVERGTVRIGTLYDFRAQEELDPVRGDAGEGQFTITLESAQRETITAENAPSYLKDYFAASACPFCLTAAPSTRPGITRTRTCSARQRFGRSPSRPPTARTASGSITLSDSSRRSAAT